MLAHLLSRENPSSMKFAHLAGFQAISSMDPLVPKWLTSLYVGWTYKPFLPELQTTHSTWKIRRSTSTPFRPIICQLRSQGRLSTSPRESRRGERGLWERGRLLYRGYFMVGECGRFFFTSCERRERTSERSERVSSPTPRNEWRKIGQTNQPWSN